MRISQLGTLCIAAIQGVLAADTLEERSAHRPSKPSEHAVVQFEPQTPITAWELRYGIDRTHQRTTASDVKAG